MSTVTSLPSSTSSSPQQQHPQQPVTHTGPTLVLSSPSTPMVTALTPAQTQPYGLPLAVYAPKVKITGFPLSHCQYNGVYIRTESSQGSLAIAAGGMPPTYVRRPYRVLVFYITGSSISYRDGSWTFNANGYDAPIGYKNSLLPYGNWDSFQVEPLYE